MTETARHNRVELTQRVFIEVSGIAKGVNPFVMVPEKLLLFGEQDEVNTTRTIA